MAKVPMKKGSSKPFGGKMAKPFGGKPMSSPKPNTGKVGGKGKRGC